MTTELQAGVPLEVSYFEYDKDGFMERRDFHIVAAYDAPLSESLSQIPPLESQVKCEGLKIICQGENSKGEVIDLDQKPINVEYIFASLHAKKIPVLFITSHQHPRHDSGISMGSSIEHSRPIHRRPSMMLRELIKSRKPETTSTSSMQNTIKISLADVSRVNSITSSPPIEDQDDEPQDVFDGTLLALSPRPTPLYRNTSQFSFDPPKKHTTLQPGLKLRHISKNKSMSVDVDENRSKRHSSIEVLTISRATPCDLPRREFSEKPHSFLKKQKAFRRKRSSTLDLHVQQLKLKVTTESGFTIEIPCHSHMPIGELKHDISHKLLRAGQLPEAGGITLTYSITKQQKDTSAQLSSTTYELVDDSQLLYLKIHNTNTLFLQDTDVVQDLITGLRVCPLRKPSRKDLVTIYRITQLTKVILDDRVTELGDDTDTCTPIAASDKTEMEAARRTLHDYMMQVTSVRSTEDYALSVEIANDAAPTTLILKVPYNNHLPVTFHYKQIFSLTKQISIHQKADSMLKEIHHCLVECDLIKNSVEAYTMQLSGVNSYIHGNYELIAFADIRRCITKKEPIHLSVLMKPSPLLYVPFQISWLPLDPYSYKPPLQIDVSEVYRKETKSLWEYPESETFKLKLVKVQNLPFHGTNLLTVEISIHYGSEMIHSARVAEVKTQDSFIMTWNENISFLTSIRDLPTAAKVLVIVRNSNSNTYYWGMINVFDHQNRIRTGDNVIQLWEKSGDVVISRRTKRTSSLTGMPMVEKKAKAFSSILSGPAVGNPDLNAVRVVLSFESHDSIIYSPSVSEESRKEFFRQHPAFRNAQLKKHFSRYLEFKFNLRSRKKPYHNLPVHLENINWGSLKDRLEMYHILETILNKEEIGTNGSVTREIEKVPLYVAFRLLDKDFPDEHVRAFATKVVEYNIKSDTLEDYLLQLTQALKFEHNHDSALARYLLNQALTDKNIGHMFFWYLRSEMQSAQYRLRFAIILEAYLKGCGEALLAKYMDHVVAQESLEVIGQKLKDTYGKDSLRMQQALPAELMNAELQKISIIPAYSPRLRLGGLRPHHCKVMQSAKKPLFLEMLNVNSTALQADPVRVIMKMGDDLRQDMITLRMLSLFEKLWENEGLDLKLIPYGCMATGPRTGFIEVVRNSKTIAEVSGVRENKKLYEWIKQHQKDEFGEVDPEKLEAAIDTFVHSCAGYSVATYILGIGDRHNDNIMITTSGNLFHIDFGHFLGNIKHFMTFKREWSPFVLTPDFTYVMGGEDSDTFRFYKHLCVRAFLILRRHSDLIINLFSMMRSTGIPELTCVEDTNYIKTALVLDKTDAEAENDFRTVIQKCLDLKWTVQLTWAFHKLNQRSSL